MRTALLRLEILLDFFRLQVFSDFVQILQQTNESTIALYNLGHAYPSALPPDRLIGEVILSLLFCLFRALRRHLLLQVRELLFLLFLCQWLYLPGRKPMRSIINDWGEDTVDERWAHLFRGLFELVMATLLRVVVRKRGVLEDLAALSTLDALKTPTPD